MCFVKKTHHDDAARMQEVGVRATIFTQLRFNSGLACWLGNRQDHGDTEDVSWRADVLVNSLFFGS